MSLKTLFEETTFLLGAGASKEAGCLLSSEMLNELKNKIEDARVFEDSIYKIYSESQQSFCQIFNFIIASLNYQSTLKNPFYDNSEKNIEDFVFVLKQLMDKEFIVPYPLVGNWNTKITNWEIKNKNIFRDFKNFITSLLINEWTKHDIAKTRKLLNPIMDIITISDLFKINIFSLNYDLTFESEFLSKEETLLDNGFSSKMSDGSLSIKYWASNYNDENSPAKINLYKLHGSLNWDYDVENEEIVIKNEIYDGREPFIIFGSYFKMLSFDPFLFMLSAFRNKLQKSKLFVAIGYSFNDRYINNLIIQQLMADPIKKLIVVSPDNINSNKFVNILRMKQESTSVNELINFKNLNPEKVIILTKTTSEFYNEFLSDSAKGLNEIYEDMIKEDEIF